LDENTVPFTFFDGEFVEKKGDIRPSFAAANGRGVALLAVTKIIEPTFGLNLYLAIALPYVYISLIAIGFTLVGLGLWRMKMKQ
jgi:hypothetical protein